MFQQDAVSGFRRPSLAPGSCTTPHIPYSIGLRFGRLEGAMSGILDSFYQKPVRDVEDLKQCLVETWFDIDQNVIYQAIDQCRNRLKAYVKPNGKHSEHLL